LVPGTSTPKRGLIESGAVTLVKMGLAMADELRAVVVGRPVYVHIDCDVLDAGTLPTDYLVPKGMTLEELRATAEVLAQSELVGLEVGEFESAPDHDSPPGYVSDLLHALDPLLRVSNR
jgi:arginase